MNSSNEKLQKPINSTPADPREGRDNGLRRPFRAGVYMRFNSHTESWIVEDGKMHGYQRFPKEETP